MSNPTVTNNATANELCTSNVTIGETPNFKGSINGKPFLTISVNGKAFAGLTPAVNNSLILASNSNSYNTEVILNYDAITKVISVLKEYCIQNNYTAVYMGTYKGSLGYLLHEYEWIKMGFKKDPISPLLYLEP